MMSEQTLEAPTPTTHSLDSFIVNHLTRIPLVDRIFFLDHLRTMIHAGLSLVEGLHVLGKETQNKKLLLIVKDVTLYVEKGNQLSDALKRYPKIFPDLQTTMIASGEIAGQLEDALEQVVVQMKKSHALTSSIKAAMIYPSVVVSAIVIIGILMVTMVLPKIISLFDEFEAELPLATHILIAVTNFLSQPLNLILILSGFFGLIFLFISLLKSSRPFKKSVHAIILKLPIFGPISKKINLARFSITLSSLLKSTIPIVEALLISSKTCKNLLYQDALEEATQKLSKGDQLSDILSEKPQLFPPMVTEMIMVGEKTGEIDHLLQELSTFYSDEVDKIMKNFATIIEPVVIILLGLGVAGIAVAVIMPMFTLTQNF